MIAIRLLTSMRLAVGKELGGGKGSVELHDLRTGRCLHEWSREKAVWSVSLSASTAPMRLRV